MKYDDNISSAEIASNCQRLIAGTETISLVDTLSELDELSDLQWHTYESMDESIVEEMEKWFVSKWTEDQGFLEALLGIGYCFGFRKEIYRKGLEAYDGEHNDEFRLNFENSNGARIDPWWSLKNQPAQQGVPGNEG